MAPVSSADIEQGRGRLLGFVFIVLAGFASLSVVFTFLGPDIVTPLQLTPSAARWGVLVLTIGFIALVWEKERQYRQWNDIVKRQEILLVSFENRLKVVEGLLETSDRLNAPLALDDVLEVILEAAVDLAGAESGSIDMFESGTGELSLSYSHETGTRIVLDPERTVTLPLVDGKNTIGRLHLTPPNGGFDEATVAILERFTVQASNAVSKAQVLARERAAAAYREAANIVKSRFLATLSHELRTPLTSMLGFTMTLARHWDRFSEEEKKEFIEEVEKHGMSMAGLLERLLEAARVEIEGIVVNPLHHDVRRSVRKALLPFLNNGSTRIEAHIPATDMYAEIDPFVVDQVVTNLVDNALRYTDGKVFVAMKSDEKFIKIQVADEGPGIQGEKLKRVLDPILWQDEDLKDGTGLGLHIVGTFVDSHGGHIDVESDEVGTRISVSFPITFDESRRRAHPQTAKPGLI